MSPSPTRSRTPNAPCFACLLSSLKRLHGIQATGTLLITSQPKVKLMFLHVITASNIKSGCSTLLFGSQTLLQHVRHLSYVDATPIDRLAASTASSRFTNGATAAATAATLLEKCNFAPFASLPTSNKKLVQEFMNRLQYIFV